MCVPPTLAAACRFVQRPNWVDLEAGEAALRSAGRYSELVALYQVRHCLPAVARVFAGVHSGRYSELVALYRVLHLLPAVAFAGVVYCPCRTCSLCPCPTARRWPTDSLLLFCIASLLQSKGRHSAALDLLHRLSQQPDQLPAPAQGASAGELCYVCCLLYMAKA